MALEDRVRALEDEVSILKNQVQSTLLEIQEQILIHYYPELRGKEAAPPDLPVPLSGNNGAAGSLPPPAAYVEAYGEVPAATPQPSPRPEEAGEPAGWAAVTPLMQWASESVERIGKERTIKAIEICGEGGCLGPELSDALLQLIALSDEEPLVEKVSLRDIVDVLFAMAEAVGRESDLAVAPWPVEEEHVG